MAKRIQRRSEWRRKTNGAWTCSTGERGARVRLFQNRRGGVFYCATWYDGREQREKLDTTDKAVAFEYGKLKLADLLRAKPDAPKEPLTLAELWRRYSAECAAFRDNGDCAKRNAEDSARVLIGYFGTDYEVASLDEDAQGNYQQARLAGGIPLMKVPRKRRTRDETRPVRATAAERDIQHLHMMLRWAARKRLLARNPLEGVARIQEKNKKQPVATWERYQATIAAMRELRSEARSKYERERWLRIEIALFLAEQTGRRIGAIRQLRWQDFDFEQQVVTWSAEADKKRIQWAVKYPATFFETVRQYQRELRAFSGYVFADAREVDGLLNRHMFDYLLKASERRAKLPKLDGGLWHAYRRKWATERKHLPTQDVAEAGGWKDHHTLLSIYQKPDKASLLAVTSCTLKLRETGVA